MSDVAGENESQLQSLLSENEELKRKVADLQATRSENEELEKKLTSLQATELYELARDKFVKLIGISFLIVTAFGLISVKSVMSEVRDEIDDRVRAKIIADVKTELIENHESAIVTQVADQMNEVIKSKVDQAELLRLAEAAIEESADETASNFAEVVVKSYEGAAYYIIAGSSTRAEDLRDLINRVRRTGGAVFDQVIGSNISICRSTVGNPYLGIGIGPMRLTEAQDLREPVVQLGFRDDTYISRAWRFDCNFLADSTSTVSAVAD